jgi:hypothetical protein
MHALQTADLPLQALQVLRQDHDRLLDSAGDDLSPEILASRCALQTTVDDCQVIADSAFLSLAMGFFCCCCCCCCCRRDG